jgi:hypothetical protein
MARSLSELKQLQSLPYEAKLIRTKRFYKIRIKDKQN